MRPLPLGPDYILAGLLFALMVFAPTTYRSTKMALLVLVLGAIAVRVLGSGVVAIARPVLSRTMLFVAAGAFFVLTGVARSAPGALHLAPVFVVWPLAYIGLVGLLDSQRKLEQVTAGLFLLLLAIEGYAVTYLGYARSAPVIASLYVPLDLGQDISSTGIEFNIYSVSSLLFLVPMAVAALFVWPRDLRIVPRWTMWVAVSLGAVLAVLSGRRALMAVILMSPFIAALFRSLLPAAHRRRDAFASTWAAAAIAAVGVMVLLESVLDAPLSHLMATATQALVFASQEDLARGPQQFSLLLAGWRGHPLLGAGLGATLPELVRSGEQPWAYELSYLALLFQTGVLGLAIYAYGLIWIYRRMRVIFSRGGRLGYLAIPIATGMTTFLIANASNPYLAKFDSLWVLFLPVAVINVSYLSRSRASSGRLDDERANYEQTVIRRSTLRRSAEGL